MSVRRRATIRGLTSSVVVVLALGACSGRSGGTASTEAPRAAPSGRSEANHESAADLLPRTPLLGRNSVWRQDVSRAPVSSDSAALVANLAKQVRDHYGGIAALNTARYSIAFYRTSPSAPRQTIAFDDCQGKGAAPAELFAASTNAPFEKVPIPTYAESAAGTDGELSVWSPQTDQLWELWKAHKVDGQWHACFGGRLDHASASTAQFPESTGVSASGLALAPAALGIREVQAGRVRHALSLGVIDAAHFGTFSYPASRSDGNLPEGTPNAIAEGQRFRLDPSVDLDTLDLTRIGRAVAEAAQRYGFIVTDRSGAVSIGAERGPAPTRGGSESWGSVFDGLPGYEQLKNFPWDKLQALPFDYGRP